MGYTIHHRHVTESTVGIDVCLDRSTRDHHVIIDEDDQVPVGQFYSVVARNGRAQVWLGGIAKRDVQLESFQKQIGSVSRSVGYNDNLKVNINLLFCYRLDCSSQSSAAVVGRHYDTDEEARRHASVPLVLELPRPTWPTTTTTQTSNRDLGVSDRTPHHTFDLAQPSATRR